jgi:hypothetical protein
VLHDWLVSEDRRRVLADYGQMADTVSHPHAVCRLEVVTASTRHSPRSRVIVQLLLSPSLGCGRIYRYPSPNLMSRRLCAEMGRPVNKLHGAPAFSARAGRAVWGSRWPRPSPVRGRRVTVTSRDGTRAEQAAEKLGNGALGVELDVRDESSVDACVERTFDAWAGSTCS